MNELSRIEPDRPLAELVARASRGEEVVLSQNGKAVARIVISEQPADRSEAIKAMQNIIDMSKGVTLGGLRFKDLTHAGHKY
ncbi:MAG TPA: type II toxin-antitoxin system prevent-host-death family antitoxin [Devosia sp.]